MNIVGKLRSTTAPLQHGRGGLSFLMSKGERYAFAGGFGFVKGYYREKSLIRGWLPTDLAVGVGATLLGAIAQVVSRGGVRPGLVASLAPHLDSLGDAGVMSWANSIGAAWGAKKSGRQVLVLNEGAKAPAQIPAGYTQVAGVEKDPGGAYLTRDQVAFYNERR